MVCRLDMVFELVESQKVVVAADVVDSEARELASIFWSMVFIVCSIAAV